MSGDSKSSPEARKAREEARRRLRSKNLAILIILCVFALLMYAVTVVRMKEADNKKRGVGTQSSAAFTPAALATMPHDEQRAFSMTRSVGVDPAIADYKPNNGVTLLDTLSKRELSL